ncbi:MAG: bifunctional ornithine acetyltransferase/N-acetylglutamate synthase [Myxococcales bacterium]|nr:bifunctional ornithine acetyltransferase/N-acetylglutamate synthase [Myxococcales bacterium]
MYGAPGCARCPAYGEVGSRSNRAKSHEMLVASTGVIGLPLDMPSIADGLPKVASNLRSRNISQFAEAILTTDKNAKISQRRIAIGGKRVTILGCTKGAGMSAPDMATTLSFVVTDAKVSPKALQEALGTSVVPTFNAISVDGNSSTNDMILAMASGSAGGNSLRGADSREFTASLTNSLDDLARKLMRDGEGVHHVRCRHLRARDPQRSGRQAGRANHCQLTAGKAGHCRLRSKLGPYSRCCRALGRRNELGQDQPSHRLGPHPGRR